MSSQISSPQTPVSNEISPTVKLWGPAIIGISTFLFLLGGIALAAINWQTMNLQHKARTFLILSITGFLAWNVLNVLSFQSRFWSILNPVLTIGIAVYTYFQTKRDIQAYKNDLVVKEGWSSAIILGLFFLVAQIFMYYTILYLIRGLNIQAISGYISLLTPIKLIQLGYIALIILSACVGLYGWPLSIFYLSINRKNLEYYHAWRTMLIVCLIGSIILVIAGTLDIFNIVSIPKFID